MFKLTFFTSSQGKLANLRYLAKDYDVEIVSFHEKTYRANYDEPRITDHKKLLLESFNDALKRWNQAYNPKDTEKKESDSHTFFIEDTSVVIHALSDEQDTPGPDIKYWMREANFEDIDKALKTKGNDRRVTVRSDILLYLPLAQRNDPENNFVHYTSTVDGFFVSKEYDFPTNALYPWLDNKTFNKWFSPYNDGKPISMLPIQEADKFDFRRKNLEAVMLRLEITKTSSVKSQLVSNKQLPLDYHSRPPIFIICGPTCTGKTTLAEYVAKEYGYSHIEASDFMYLAFYQLHSTDSPIKIIDFAKQVLKDIPHIVASQIIDYANKHKINPFVISGFRNAQEISWFHDNYTEAPIVTLYIESDFETRYTRCLQRGREDFKSNKREFEATNKKQNKMGLFELKETLGRTGDILVNDHDKRSLYKLFKKVYSHHIESALPIQQNQSGKEFSLEDWILLALLKEYESHNYFTTTQISKLINELLPRDEKKKEKDNVSRYFNQKFHPYYEIRRIGKFNKYRLSNTGYSLALQKKQSSFRINIAI